VAVTHANAVEERVLQSERRSASERLSILVTREIADLQQEFVGRNAAQCGFCTPGMLLTATELLQRAKPMDRSAIREYIGGNFCRCTGYHAIVDAIEAVLNRRLAPKLRP